MSAATSLLDYIHAIGGGLGLTRQECARHLALSPSFDSDTWFATLCDEPEAIQSRYKAPPSSTSVKFAAWLATIARWSPPLKRARLLMDGNEAGDALYDTTVHFFEWAQRDFLTRRQSDLLRDMMRVLEDMRSKCAYHQLKPYVDALEDDIRLVRGGQPGLKDYLVQHAEFLAMYDWLVNRSDEYARIKSQQLAPLFRELHALNPGETLYDVSDWEVIHHPATFILKELDAAFHASKAAMEAKLTEVLDALHKRLDEMSALEKDLRDALGMELLASGGPREAELREIRYTCFHRAANAILANHLHIDYLVPPSMPGDHSFYMLGEGPATSDTSRLALLRADFQGTLNDKDWEARLRHKSTVAIRKRYAELFPATGGTVPMSADLQAAHSCYLTTTIPLIPTLILALALEQLAASVAAAASTAASAAASTAAATAAATVNTTAAATSAAAAAPTPVTSTSSATSSATPVTAAPIPVTATSSATTATAVPNPVTASVITSSTPGTATSAILSAIGAVVLPGLGTMPSLNPVPASSGSGATGALIEREKELRALRHIIGKDPEVKKMVIKKLGGAGNNFPSVAWTDQVAVITQYTEINKILREFILENKAYLGQGQLETVEKDADAALKGDKEKVNMAKVILDKMPAS